MHDEQRDPHTVQTEGRDAAGNVYASSDLDRPAAAIYAIACQGRQGSTYLERILDAHPQVHCAGEIFSDFAFKGYGLHDIKDHLRHRVLSNSKPLVGFKLSVGDIMRHPELVETVRALGINIIRLTRDNLLDQYISGRLAVANGSFVSDIPGKGISSFMVSQLELKSAFEWLSFTDIAMASLTSGLRTLWMTYEKLVDPRNHPAIFDFLGVEPLAIEPRTKKQRAGGQRDAIENYDEMKDAFVGTRWARYFVE